MQTISTKKLAALLTKQTIHLIDVRETDEFHVEHLSAAKNYPLSTIADWLPTLDPRQHYYLICRSGKRSHRAAAIFRIRGYWATNVAGGILSWTSKSKRKKGPVVSDEQL